jgi:hypothetical protein
VLGEEAVASPTAAARSISLPLAVRERSREHLERALIVDRVAFHQDPLGSLDRRAAPERALELVVLAEAAQHVRTGALGALSMLSGDEPLLVNPAIRSALNVPLVSVENGLTRADGDLSATVSSCL